MLNKQRIVVIALLAFAVALVVAWQWAGKSSDTQVQNVSDTNVSTSPPNKPSDLPASSTPSGSIESTSVNPGLSGLDESLLNAVLQHIARGGFIKDSPEFQRFLDLAVQDHR